jgi:hypothetical protein
MTTDRYLLRFTAAVSVLLCAVSGSVAEELI